MPLKRFLLLIFMFSSFNIYAQSSNLIFNTNNSAHKFKLFINGELKNNYFEQNVRLPNIEAKNYRIKILFQNKMLGYIQKNIYVRPNTEKIYTFTKQGLASGRRRVPRTNMTSLLSLDLLSEVPLHSVDDEFMGESNDEYDAIAYTTTASPMASRGANKDIVIGSEKNNVTIGRNGIDINFDVNEFVDKIITSEEENIPNSDNHSNNEISYEPKTENTTEISLEEEEIENNSCTPTFTNNQFALVIERLEKEGFESKKLEIAKAVARENCLLTKQVRDVINIFNFENNRVDFAKFAYDNVADKENYDLLLDSFKFETSKQEIREYIR